MDANYRLDILSPAGVLLDTIGWESVGDDPSRSTFKSLTCQLRVNKPGRLVAQFPSNHLLIDDLEDRSQIELWEEVPEAGIEPHRFFSGIYRSPRFKDYGPRGVFTLVADGDMSLLDWRIVNYYAGRSDRSQFISKKAEYIMKFLVYYNITNLATTGQDRKRNGTNWPATEIDVESGNSLGTTLDWYCHGDNLLKTLQELTRVGGGDFSLAKVNGAKIWEFRFHLGQLGTDRTATVLFSAERDNIDDLTYLLDRSKERTVACVWGNEKGEYREYLTRTGINYTANNDREVYVSAAGVETTVGRENRGDAKLDRMQAREAFDFVARLDQLYVFNKDVFLGDLVNVVNYYTGASLTGKVMGANLVLKPDARQMSLEIKTS